MKNKFHKLLFVLVSVVLTMALLTSCADINGGNGGGTGDIGGGSFGEPVDTYQREVLRLVNAERAKRGISPMELANYTALSAAQLRAQELAEVFSHTRPNGSDCFSVLDEAGVSYGYAGENIAWGYNSLSTPAEVVEEWMNSPGHRANILTPEFTKLAVGYYCEGSDYYWVQIFIG